MKWIGQHIYDLVSRFRADVYIEKGLRDKDGELGTSGQILSSTGTQTNWINAPSGSVGTLQTVTANGNSTSYGIEFTSTNFSIGQSKIGLFSNNVIYLRGGSGGLVLSNGDGQQNLGFIGNYIRWETGSSEKMRLTSDGDLGLGVTSPSKRLHVYDTTSGIARLETNQTYSDVELKTNNGTAYVSARDGHVLLNRTGGNNVGIGTDSPSYPLHVVGNIKTTNKLLVEDSSNSRLELASSISNQARISAHKTNLNQTLPLLIQAEGIKFGTVGGGEKMRLTSAGELCVGYTSNQGLTAKFLVNGNAYFSGNIYPNQGILIEDGSFSAPSLKFNNDTNTGLYRAAADTVGIAGALTGTTATFSGQVSAGTHFKLQSGGKLYSNASNVTLQSASGSYLGFNISTSEKMRLNDTGLGIGTSDPQKKLDIAGGDIRLDNSKGIYFSTLDANVGRVKIIGDESSDFIHMSVDNSNSHVIRLGTTGVGIGTTSPLAKLQVTAGSSGVSSVDTGTSAIIESNTTNYLRFVNPDDATGGLVWTSTSDNFAAFIRWKFNDRVLQVATAKTNSHIGFLTGNADEHMRLTSDGKLGLGTTSPLNILHVETSGNTVARFKSTDNNSNIVIQDDDTTGYISAEGSVLGMGFTATKSANNINVNSSGNVGIGTVNPLTNLQLGSFGTANQEFRIESDGNSYFSISTTNGVQKIYAGGAGTQSNEMAFYTSSSGTESERMRLKSGGNVLIGTTTDDGSSKLQVAGNLLLDSKYKFSIINTDLYLTDASNSHTAKIYQDGQFGSHIWYVNNSEKLRLNSTGLGIGTASPAQPLHVYKGGNSGVLIEGTNVSYLKLKDPSSDGHIGTYNDGTLRIGAQNNAATTHLVIKSDGKVGIGTSTAASKLDVRGTVQVGVDDTGHDVIFYGATSGKKMHWDESADKLIVDGTLDVNGPLEIEKYMEIPHVADPSDPASGKSVMWSDTSGNLKIKINVAGTVVTRTIAAFEG